MFKAHDHIDIKIYIYIQIYKYTMTYNHDNSSLCFWKSKPTSMAHDHIDFVTHIYTLLMERNVEHLSKHQYFIVNIIMYKMNFSHV